MFNGALGTVGLMAFFTIRIDFKMEMSLAMRDSRGSGGETGPRGFFNRYKLVEGRHLRPQVNFFAGETEVELAISAVFCCLIFLTSFTANVIWIPFLAIRREFEEERRWKMKSFG